MMRSCHIGKAGFQHQRPPTNCQGSDSQPVVCGPLVGREDILIGPQNHLQKSMILLECNYIKMQGTNRYKYTEKRSKFYTQLSFKGN